MIPPTCPACALPGRMIDSALLYRTSHGQVWVCANWPTCDYRVGAHPDGTPLGTMADAALRQLRIRAHGVFDRWWKAQGMTRGAAYRELAQLMGGSAHISWMDPDECRRVVEHYSFLLRAPHA